MRKLTVICPGFSLDCLESLEEIAITARESFLEHGGESFDYVPALNDRTDHVAVLARLVRTAR
jgi:ferrochelatase